MTHSNRAYYIGCISGTSVDGLDLALLDMQEPHQPKFIASNTASFPNELRECLLEIGRPGEDDIDGLGWADAELGTFIGQAIQKFLGDCELDSGDICAIGSHGQTVRHRPTTAEKPYGFSLQIGDANRIAEVTGVTTVADFRRRDMAAGGQGAPLVPPFHKVLFGRQNRPVAVLNIGGISNISVLDHVTSGFDTGPGNALMDIWCANHTGQSYDENGQWAGQGNVDSTLLKTCLTDPYFQLPPPKSTGREYFNLAWLDKQLAHSNAQPVDVQATLNALTALCTTQALETWAPQVQDIVVCGGGRLNQTLVSNLRRHSPANVSISEDWDIDGDSIEAGLFAWLAYQTMNNLSGNEPAVTGASDYRVLGAIYPG